MIKKQEKGESPSGEVAVSTRIEKKQVEERIAITAHVIYETIRREGDEELHRPASALAWSALAASAASAIAERVRRGGKVDYFWKWRIGHRRQRLGHRLHLATRRTEFVEYDVEADLAARKRMHSLANGQRTVPMLVDGDEEIQIGWQGRGCVVSVE